VRLSLLGFRKIPASTGLTAPSAVENRVFSIAILRSFDSILSGFSATREGITGNFSALVHLNLVSLVAVENLRLPHFSSSTVTSLSLTRAI
jgi:hypothetical protein